LKQASGIMLGDTPLLVFTAGNGLNNTELVNISNRSSFVYFPDADHYLPFREAYATEIATTSLACAKFNFD